jgi:hypothetical protein
LALSALRPAAERILAFWQEPLHATFASKPARLELIRLNTAAPQWAQNVTLEEGDAIMQSRRRLFLAVAFLALGACATGPAYQEREPGETTGYTDEQLTPNRYRVTFSGGSGVRREEVENYLLRRAAEVTLDAGQTHFVFDTRSTEAQTYYRTSFNNFGPRFGFGPWFGPRPYYGYWSSWNYPAFSSGYAIPVNRYYAYAEILMLTPEQASHNPAAIDARELLNRLVPVPEQPQA